MSNNELHLQWNASVHLTGYIYVNVIIWSQCSFAFKKSPRASYLHTFRMYTRISSIILPSTAGSHHDDTYKERHSVTRTARNTNLRQLVQLNQGDKTYTDLSVKVLCGNPVPWRGLYSKIDYSSISHCWHKPFLGAMTHLALNCIR